MEFIVDQQAQFASDIGQLGDVVGRLANASLNRIKNLDDKAMRRTTELLRSAEMSIMAPDNPRGRFQLGKAGYVSVQFADSFFRREPQVLKGQRQIFPKFNGAARRRTGRRIEEIVFVVDAHGVRIITSGVIIQGLDQELHRQTRGTGCRNSPSLSNSSNQELVI